MEYKETNLFDLLIKAFNACKRFFLLLGSVFTTLLRLSFRQWWIILIVLILSAAASLYYSREANRMYDADATLILNGPTVEATTQAINRAALPVAYCDAQNYTSVLGLDDATASAIKHIKIFHVIDCLADSTADYVDYKRKSVATDTLNVQMKDRLAVRIRLRNVNALPTIEQALLNYLNNLPQMQEDYASYRANLEQEADYCHRQFIKLDSLTSCFYFEQAPNLQLGKAGGSSSIYVGDRRIRLFLGSINSHLKQMRYVDWRLEKAKAPVVAENHFIINPRAVNGRFRTLAIALVAGWLLGCLIAAIVEKRKNIIAWLKK